MNRWLAALVTALGLLLYHGHAQASCSTHTIFTADGRAVICTTCCYGTTGCTTTCF